MSALIPVVQMLYADPNTHRTALATRKILAFHTKAEKLPARI